MAALDLLGRRWALRLLWELRGGPVGARALRERCDGMSSSVLYERLTELRTAFTQKSIRTACESCEWFDLCTGIANTGFDGAKLQVA